MKRYILFLIALLISINSVRAEIPQDDIKFTRSIENSVKYVPADAPFEFEGKKSGPETQAISSMIIARFPNLFYSHLSTITPIVYDPISKITYVTGMDVGQNRYIMQVIYSTNQGTTWLRRTVFDIEETGAFWPSIAVTNYTGSSNFNEIPFFISGVWGPLEDGSFRFSGAATVDFKNGEATPNFMFGPNDNNPQDGFRWDQLKLTSLMVDGDGLVFSGSMLRVFNESNQYGTYGFYVWHVNEGKFFTSKVSSEWSPSEFKSAGATNSSWNGKIETGADENGWLYGAVNNMFTDNNPIPDDRNRNPGVAKSVDYGDSWDNFNQFPYTLINTYATENGGTMGYVVDPYAMDAFVVTAPDEYSYFFRMIVSDGTNATGHIVESYYKDGTWGIRKVGNFGGTPPVLPTILIRSRDFQGLYRVAVNPIGNELQVAKTADGTSLLVKWVDALKEKSINPPVTVTQMVNSTEEQTTMDAVYLSDVIIAHRGIDETSWSEPINKSDGDDYNYYGTWIPDIIPSLNEIPMIFHRSQENPDPTTYPATVNLTPDMIKIVTDIPSFVNFTTLSVNVNNVRAEDKYNFRLNDIYPNPANGSAQISFVLDADAQIKIELYNSLGQIVDVILDSFQPAGPHVFPLNTSKYISGSYYFTLTVGTQQITKMLNIIK